MSNRFSTQSRKITIAFIVERDGTNCGGCSLTLGERDKILSGKGVEIDHKNGEKFDRNPTNLRLMHKACNIRAYREQVRTALKFHSTMSPEVVREREKVSRPPTTEDGYSSVKNFEVEPRFRMYCFTVVKALHDVGELKKRADIIADGAAFCGCSIQACYRYLSKLLAPTYGPLEPIRNKDEKVCVQFKYQDDYSLSVEELARKYPYEGFSV